MRVVSLVGAVRWLALLGALAGVGRQTALAQELALSSRAPRFLAATSPRGAMVEVDAGQSALLRQVVSLNIEQPTVGRLLAEIERQAGLRFGYSGDILPIDRVVALRADTITVGAALVSILMGTGLDVLLAAGRQVTLVERSPRARPVPQGGIGGRVTDAKTGVALDGVEVFLEGTRWRAATDTSGRYRLPGVDTGSYTLTARRFGFAKQSRAVTVAAGQEDVVDIALVPVPTKMDELVTTAAGPRRRLALGNAITTIRVDSVMQAAPIQTVTDLLNTRVPGLLVQPTTGAPGDPARLRLRGPSSVLRSNDPIVIVDGIRIYSDQSNVRSGNLADLAPSTTVSQRQVAAPSPLDQLDPNSVESIEVFKGPSAAMLYGADAANGVIVITTKRGKVGPAQWTLNVTHGWTRMAGEYPEGYFRWGHNLVSGSAQETCGLTDLSCVQDSLVRFQALNDPSLTIFGRGAQTSTSVGVSGGSEALQYALEGSYGTETGLLTLPQSEIDRFRQERGAEAPDWMRRPQHLTEWRGSSRITARLSRTADVSLTTALTSQEQRRSSLENQIGVLAGTYVDVPGRRYYRQNGWIDPNSGEFITEYYQRTTASAVNLTTGLQANWRPASWLTAAADAGVNVITRNDESLVPREMRRDLSDGMLNRGTGQSLLSTVNVRATAAVPLAAGLTLQTTVGANYTGTSTKDLLSQGMGLAEGTNSLNGAQEVRSTEQQVNSAVFGWFIEPSLSHRRFTLSTGLRLDGGTGYGTRATLSAFPKVQGSWLISDEPFFPLRGLFDALRLRAAYGQAGVEPGATDRLRLFSRSRGWVNGDVDDVAQLTTLGNTRLKPERSTEFEGGVDADLLDGLLSVEVTGYRKTRVDALMPVPIPPSVYGGGAVLMNVGVVRNTGLELSLGLTPVRSSGVTWSSQLHLSRVRNLVTELGPGVEPFFTGSGRIVAGYPLFGRWVRPIVGYADANGDGIIARDEVQVGDSLAYMGETMPNYEVSLHTNLALLNGALTIGASFDYQDGQTQVNQLVRTNTNLNRGANDPSAPFGEQAAIAAMDATDYGLMQTVSTLRFNALSVRYALPRRAAALLGARYASVAVQGSNLGLHTNYRGKDPSVNAAPIGNDVFDAGQLPQPREWSVRVDLRY